MKIQFPEKRRFKLVIDVETGSPGANVKKAMILDLNSVCSSVTPSTLTMDSTMFNSERSSQTDATMEDKKSSSGGGSFGNFKGALLPESKFDNIENAFIECSTIWAPLGVPTHPQKDQVIAESKWEPIEWNATEPAPKQQAPTKPIDWDVKKPPPKANAKAAKHSELCQKKQAVASAIDWNVKKPSPKAKAQAAKHSELWKWTRPIPSPVWSSSVAAKQSLEEEELPVKHIKNHFQFGKNLCSEGSKSEIIDLTGDDDDEASTVYPKLAGATKQCAIDLTY